MSSRLIDVPACVPRTQHPIGRWIGRTALRLGGWRLVGEFPAEKKLVILAAPHSSGWDAIWGLAAKLALGLRLVFMGKQELFRGPVGWMLRRMGATPVDRARAHGVVDQIVAQFNQADALWFVLAPEGTRKHVRQWKTGFWHIARDAGVPVLCAYFDYPSRTIGIGAVFEMTADVQADMARVREFYRPFIGKHRGTI